MLVITHKGDKMRAHSLREAIRVGETQATADGLVYAEGWHMRLDRRAIILVPNVYGAPRVVAFEG